MSVVRQVTKYLCDGCGYETEQPHEWRSLGLCGSGMLTAGVLLSEDYCPTCVQKMRQAIRGLEEAR